MASEFIGLAVLITLKDPGNTRLHGTIVNIIEKDLVLANVTFLNNGYHIPTYTVQGPMIESLDVVPSNYPQEEAENIPPSQTQQIPTSVTSNSSVQSFQPQPAPPVANQPSSTPAVPASQFVDPAILSFTRAAPPPVSVVRPPVAQVSTQNPLPPNYIATPPQPPPTAPRSTGNGPTLRAHQSVPVLRQNPSTAAKVISNHSQGPTVGSSTSNVARKQQFTTPQRPAVLQPAFQELSLRDVAGESSAFDETDDALSSLPIQQPSFGKRGRRGNKGRRQEQGQEFFAPKSVPSGYGQSKLGNGKHQRKYSKNGQQYHNGNGDEEGWATEDVNDIRDTEFDFQGNLDRFDKKTVFSQIRAEDTTADEARLVSFNRLPQRKDKAPTRKNYRNTENVLGTYTNGQPLEERDAWNSPILGEEDSDSTESGGFGRGREDVVNSGRNSRRAMSRSIPRRPSTKQGSISASGLMTQGASSSGGGGPINSTQEPKSKGSIRISYNTRPGQAVNPLDAERNRICPIVSPLQMLDVERIAETEMGLEEILMTENAARGIATVAIQAFGTRLTSQNHNPLPVVLVFAGNNKTGARAIAAGRHLKNHHVRVMVCVVGLDREDELLENVRRQLNIFRNAGGRVARLSELATSLKSLDSPPELIIDGLLGIHISFEDLRTDDQATAFELVNFANKSSAGVLAVDVPSGIDGHTGEMAQLEPDSGDGGRGHGQGFCVRARWVVSLGAPKTGLLNALDRGLGGGWKLFVADVGIPSAAWRKYGSRRRHGVEFGAEWVIPVEHVMGH